MARLAYDAWQIASDNPIAQVPGDLIRVTSGFRPPMANRAIAATVQSRHQSGEAIDVGLGNRWNATAVDNIEVQWVFPVCYDKSKRHLARTCIMEKYMKPVFTSGTFPSEEGGNEDILKLKTPPFPVDQRGTPTGRFKVKFHKMTNGAFHGHIEKTFTNSFVCQ